MGINMINIINISPVLSIFCRIPIKKHCPEYFPQKLALLTLLTFPLF